jgi:dihydrofolate synthase/folylpolyglutamate synthase
VFELPKYGEGICLARMADLLSRLEIDRAGLQRRSIVVTGSNGKGSTSAFCAGIARAYGLRTGLFTSPHLYRFNERFQVDGTSISDDDLAPLAARIKAAIMDVSRRSREQFGAFEAMFALACLYFQETECEFAIFEAGIGGRYDPVRLIGARETCVTSIDYEHVELLGHSLELIVADKSDACAAGGTIIYGENCRNLRPHITEYNRHREVSSLFVRDDIQIGGETHSPATQRFDFTLSRCHLPALETHLLGAFQINNAAVAAALFLRWLERTQTETTVAAFGAAVRSGLRDTHWPGRLEVIGREPFTVIDVGHTPDAIRQSLSSLKAIHGAQDWILVAGVSLDKKADAIMAALAPSFDTIICTKAHHKGGDINTLVAATRKNNSQSEIRTAPTIEDAVRLSRTLAATPPRKIYVAGGLFTAVEFATIAGGGDAKDLDFF